MWHLAAIALGLSATALSAAQPQTMGPVMPRVVPERRCPPPDPNADGEEIVVCGERPTDNSPYRIPLELRDRGPVEDRDASWDSRVRDMESIERFSSQNVGPSGMTQRSRQIDCEWRAARQLAQGRQPDCTRRNRPDSPADWERR